MSMKLKVACAVAAVGLAVSLGGCPNNLAFFQILGEPVPACPDQGSNAAGVAAWRSANCNGDACVSNATTCNSEATIELLSVDRNGSLVTFSYEVCKQSAPNNLNRVMLALDQFDCLADGMTLTDLVANCTSSFADDDCVLSDTPDNQTQIIGLRWNVQDPPALCNQYSVTLDESALADGYVIGVGCVLAATRVGGQNIANSQQDSPGYACVAGPVCVMPEDEGCSQGFWKNHPDDWPAGTAGLTLDDVFDFPESLASLRTVLLSDALEFRGGPTLEDAAKILMRQAVAAYLNALHPDISYPRTAGSIVDDVNAALATEDRDTILDLKDELDEDNNIGCPLGEEEELE